MNYDYSNQLSTGLQTLSALTPTAPGATTRLNGVLGQLRNIEDRLVGTLTGLHGASPAAPTEVANGHEPPPNMMSVVSRLETIVSRIQQHAEHISHSL